jgi:hypothetical protein
VSLELVTTTFPLNCRVALSLRIGQHHGLVKEIEAVDFVNSAGSGFDVVKDDEGLALGLEIGLCDDLYDGSIFREDLLQGGFQLVDFDSLV